MSKIKEYSGVIELANQEVIVKKNIEIRYTYLPEEPPMYGIGPDHPAYSDPGGYEELDYTIHDSLTGDEIEEEDVVTDHDLEEIILKHIKR